MRSSEKVKGSLYSPLFINDLVTKRFCNRLLHDGIPNISLELKLVLKIIRTRWLDRDFLLDSSSQYKT